MDTSKNFKIPLKHLTHLAVSNSYTDVDVGSYSRQPKEKHHK